MNEIPLEERFFDYLSGLNRHIEADGLSFDSSRSLVGADTIEVFHDVCMAFGVTKLMARGNLYYFHTTRLGDPLVIKLKGQHGHAFSKQYKHVYTIIPFHKQPTP